MRIKCPNCGYEGKPNVRNRGSVFLLIILLLCGFVPGIIYLLWMASGRKVTCPACTFPHVVRK